MHPLTQTTRLTVFLLVCLGGSASSQELTVRPTARARSASERGMYLVENLGQWDQAVRFRLQRDPVTCWFTDDRIVLGLVKYRDTLVRDAEARVGVGLPRPLESQGATAIALSFARSSCEKVEGAHELATRFHFSRGPDASKWIRAARGFRQLSYRHLWPGIDATVLERDGMLSYDLCLRPGARVGQVVIDVQGVDELALGEDGSLFLRTAIGVVRQTPPVCWSTRTDGSRRVLRGSFVLLGASSYGFEVDGWDGETELVIDPGLDWGTFLGGSKSERIMDVALDDRDRIIAIGHTDSVDYPNRLNSFAGGYDDSYVSFIDPSLPPAQQILWTHYLGGQWDEIAFDAKYANGRMIVVGYSSSPNFPTTKGCYQPTSKGGYEGYITQLDAQGNLLYSTFLGGSGYDRITGVSAAGPGGLITVAGYTQSGDFPTTPGALQTKLKSPSYDAFVARLDPSSSQLVVSTLLGGSGDEGFYHPSYSPMNWDLLDLHVAASGVTTVGLYTTSLDIPVKNAFQDKYRGVNGEMYFARLDFKLTQILWASYLGSTADDSLTNLAVDANGVIRAAGGTWGPDFPVTNGAFQASSGGVLDCAFVRLDPNEVPAKQLVYGSYVGGLGTDYAFGMTSESSGVMTACGLTYSSDLPVTVGAWQTSFAPPSTAFVLRIDPANHGKPDLHYLSYQGVGSIKSGGWEYLTSTCLASDGYAVCAGSTDNPRYQVRGGFRTQYYGGGSEGTVLRLDLLPRDTARWRRASPPCAAPVWLQVNGNPTRPNAGFSILCNQAPPNAAGVFVLGSMLPSSVPVLGVDLHVLPLLVLPTTADVHGGARLGLPIPGFLPRPSGVALQWLWLSPSRCNGAVFLASHALEIL